MPADIDGCEVIQCGTNGGYTAGANLALRIWAERFPRAEFAVIGSHDLHVAPDCLDRLRSALDSDESLGIVGPVLESAPRSTGGDWRAWRRSQSFDATIAAAQQPVRRAWVSGTCLMIRRSCADAVGGFDESFGSYVEDVDFCLRAGDAEWGVAVVPTARAHGLGSASTRSRSMIAENRYRLLVKRYGLRGALMGVAEAVRRIPGLLARGLLGRPGKRWDYLREASLLARAIVRVPLKSRCWRRRRERSCDVP